MVAACGSRTGLDLAGGGTTIGDDAAGVGMLADSGRTTPPPDSGAGVVPDATMDGAGDASDASDSARVHEAGPVNPMVSCAGYDSVEVGSPWPMQGRCPDRRSLAAVAGPRTTPHVVWSAQGGSSNVVIGADGTIYTGRTTGIVALWPDGSVRWFRSDAPGDLAIGASGTVYNWASVATGYEPDGGSTGRVVSGDAYCLGLGGEILAARRYPNAQLAGYDANWQSLWTQLIASDARLGGMAVDRDGAIFALGWRTLETSVPQSGEVHAFAADGTPEWSSATVAVPRDFAYPVVAPDHVVLYADADGLAALGPGGSPTWRATVGRPLHPPSIGPDGTIYMVDFDEYLHALAPDGTPKWTATVHPFEVTPLIGADGILYGAIDSGTTVALDPKDGSTLWTLPGGGLPVAIGGDGTLYAQVSWSTINALAP